MPTHNPGAPEPLATPDLDGLQQQDAPALPMAPVPVAVEGPVLTHELPSRIGPIDMYQLSATAWTKILYADRKRKTAQVLFTTQDALISRTGSGSVANGAPWPKNIPLPISHCDELYAAAATAGTVATVVQEVWAD